MKELVGVAGPQVRPGWGPEPLRTGMGRV